MFVYISAKTAYALGIGDWSSDVCSSDLPGREQGDHLRLADRRGGEDAGACRAALHFAHRQPFLPRQGAERIEPEAASADACPVRAVGGAALGNAIREGEGETEAGFMRSEEHTSELQSLMRISYAVFCLKKKNNAHTTIINDTQNTYN